MPRRIIGLAVVAVLYSLTSMTSCAAGSQGAVENSARVPNLIVLLVVDQMRADYGTRFRSDWTGGLKRLTTEGAWFSNAAYPYLMTDTCAGHATIATGTFPHVHGMIADLWWDRVSGKRVGCTGDPQAANVGYVTPATGGDSGRNLQVPTFADEMRRQRGARVVSVAGKARSAIGMAGHGGDAVAWLSESFDY